MSKRRGPVEDRVWPTQLRARVVDEGSTRIHGYDVVRDLAVHYGFAESVLIALTGEAPTREQGRAFTAAMTVLMTTTVAEAPAHAAVLARLCGARWPSVVSTAAVVLAEQAAALLERHRAWLAWLDAPDGVPPDVTATTADEAERARHFLGRCDPSLGVPGDRWPASPTLVAAALGIAHACGLRRCELVVTAIVTARLCVVAAEAMAQQTGRFEQYPMDVPPIRYEEDDVDES
jgi:hypothetical protein